jgi:4-methyl-5(b-hydroxyethyl)-thiazole monophosphate biosynthesis
MKKRVLCIIADGFEEIELVTPVDLLRRAGVDVVLASIGGLQVTGRSGITLLADALLSDAGADYDLLLLPGGPAVANIRQDGRARELAGQFATAGKWLAAICAAPLILLDAGLLEGRNFTAHDSTYADLPDADLTQAVIRDGNLITSRGAGTALAFGLELVAVLCGEATCKQIAASILV